MSQDFSGHSDVISKSILLLSIKNIFIYLIPIRMLNYYNIFDSNG